jgi:hypothetical protein
VGGALLQAHPEDAKHWIGLVSERPDDCVGEFENAGSHWYLAYRKGAGVDYSISRKEFPNQEVGAPQVGWQGASAVAVALRHCPSAATPPDDLCRPCSFGKDF